MKDTGTTYAGMKVFTDESVPEGSFRLLMPNTPEWDLVKGDCTQVMALMEENSVDAVVADPPYLYEFMGKGWDKAVNHREWHCAWAKEALRILKPGGYLLAFGGPRTYHHLTSGIEEAGFEIRDSVMWIHSQGFPKSKNLKPAHEPIAVARKPFKGSLKANVKEWGTGEFNIDAARIGDEGPPSNRFINGAKPFGDAVGEPYETTGPTEGRWPANLAFEEGVDLDERYFFCAKASKKEKDAGLTDEKPNDRFRTRRCTTCKKNVPQPGSCGCPDAEIEWVEAKPTKNVHPTVKPIELMRWLVRLVTPPGGLVVDPFVGSGTTGIAAVQEGFDFLGIDRDDDDEYLEIARLRMEHWDGKEEV
jgi:DNA modification methylase